MTVLVNSTETTNEDLYVQQLEFLREEMTRSMRAISGNSLQVLEESLWRQEVLCVSLQRLVRALGSGNAGSAAMARVRSATTDLHRLNQTYARLIQQSKASCDLMYGLCASYAESSLRDSPTSIGHPYPLEA